MAKKLALLALLLIVCLPATAQPPEDFSGLWQRKASAGDQMRKARTLTVSVNGDEFSFKAGTRRRTTMYRTDSRVHDLQPMLPLKTRSVHPWAAPTSRLEAGVPSAFRGRGRSVAPVPK